MDNHSIQLLLLVGLALLLQILLAWLVIVAGKRLHIGFWRQGGLMIAGALLLSAAGWQVAPEQLPICTESLLGYLRCLGL